MPWTIRSRSAGDDGSVGFAVGARRLTAAAVIAVAGAIALLGWMGARLGPFVVPNIGVSGLTLAIVGGFFLAPHGSRSRSFRPMWQLGSATALALAGFVLVARLEALRVSSPAVPIAISSVSEPSSGLDGTVFAAFPRLPERKYLLRLTGKRRDVVLSVKGWFSPPAAGLHYFRLECDDRCTLDISDHVVREGPSSVYLERGPHSLELRYEQDSGPARLVVDWRGPETFEPFGFEHYVAADPRQVSAEVVGEKTREGTVLLLLGLLVCGLGAVLVVSAGEKRKHWHTLLSTGRTSRLVPEIAAGLLIAYGAILRVDALLVRSHWVSENPSAARVHRALVPYLPDYDAFDPGSYEESPYRADAKSYLDRALTLRWDNFYDPQFREPVQPALVRAFVAICGGRSGLLMESVFFSVAVLILLYLLSRHRFGSWIAVGCLVPLVLNEWLVREAPSGYRESAYAFFLVAFAGWVFSPRFRYTRAAILAGVLASATCLIRLSGLSFVVPLLGLAYWERRREGGGGYVAVATVVLLLLIGPYLWNSYRVHGDPFYSVSVHTRYWMEHEGRSAPSRRVSLARYFLDFHKPAELVLGHTLGLTWLPLRTFWKGLSQFPLLDATVIAAGIFGFALAFFGTPRFPLVAYLGHLVPFAYIQSFPSGDDPRFVIPAYYFLVLAAGFALRRWTAPPAGGSAGPQGATPGCSS
jgi:hypothetical protein